MLFNRTDDEIFAASLRERFPNHAEQVMSETDLPIRTIASPIWLPAKGTSSPAARKELPLPPSSPTEDERFFSPKRLPRITSNTFATSDQKQSDLSTQEVIDTVRSLRQRLCCTQRAFAEKLGVSPRTLQDWEQGRRRPSGPAMTLLECRLKELDPGLLASAAR